MSKTSAPEPGSPQAHDPGTMPFGAHDAVGGEKGDPVMRDPREDAMIRLQRQAIGATPEQAAQLLEQVDIDTIASESDAQLAKRIRLLNEQGYNPHDHTIDEVKEHVGSDLEVAQVMLAAELESSKPRKTLVEWLQQMTSAPDAASSEGNPENDESGAEGESDDGGTQAEADSS